MAKRKEGHAGYTVLRPTGRRKTFGLRWEFVRNGKKKSKTVNDPRLTAINTSYKSGELVSADAEAAIEALRQKLTDEKIPPQKLLPEMRQNLKILDRYRDEVISRKKRKAKTEEYYKLKRALEKLGNRNLYRVTQDELQRIVDSASGNVERKLASAFHTLLRFIKRSDVKLRVAPRTHQEIKHLTESEFRRIIREIEARHGDRYPLIVPMLWIAFGAGLRKGEIVGLDTGDLISSGSRQVLYVQRQYLASHERKHRGLTFDLPKTRRKRHVALIFPKQTVAAFKKWTSVPVEERNRMRDKAGEILQEICMRLFPGRPHTHGQLHMLRASHCVYFIQKGAPIGLVAANIGDSVETTQRYYSGFVHSDSSIKQLMKFTG